MIESDNKVKRNEFRKEIRRKQIQQIFATKRKLASQSSISNTQIQPEDNLLKLFELLKFSHDLDGALTSLGNYLWQEDSLLRFKNHFGATKLEQVCVQIVSHVMLVIMPSLRSAREEHENCRKKCLTIVSNLMADSEAHHSNLLILISEGLTSIYSTLSETTSEEADEVGWLLANSICHRLDLSLNSDLQKPIQQMLGIAQQLALMPNLQMFSVFFKNIKIFFEYVDQFFNTQNQITEHFKVHRLILFQNAVNFSLTIELGTKLLPVISFVQANLRYSSSVSDTFHDEICKKCLKLLSITSSQKIMLAIFGLLKMLLVDRNIIVRVVKDSLDTILKCIMFHGINIKISALRMLCYMCIDKEITVFISRQKELEHLLIQMIKTVRDHDILLQIIVLCRVIINQTDSECGLRAILTIQDNLSHKTGEVGRQALQISSQYSAELENIKNNSMI